MLVVWWFYGDITTLPGTELPCATIYTRGTSAFMTCAQAEADRFFKIDYSESKDLAKAFLTLVTAVFVASVTFSEKIVDMKTASNWAKTSMLLCWLLLLIAIAACGSGLVYMIFALGTINYEYLQVWGHETRALILFVTSGIAFGIGLFCMLFAGIPSLFAKPEVAGLAPAQPGTGSLSDPALLRAYAAQLLKKADEIETPPDDRDIDVEA